MDQKFVVHPQVRTWLQRSIIDPHVDKYISYLRDLLYSLSTERSYVYAVAHFAYWLSLEKASLIKLSEETLSRFLSAHLPICDCPYPVHRTTHESRAAISHLLRVLRLNRAITNQQKDAGPLDQELASFDRYMDHVRGLSPSTRRQRLAILRKFLLEEQGQRLAGTRNISVSGIKRFVLKDRGSHNAGTVMVIGGALRCYFKFRSLEGDQVQRLLSAVPTAAHWRLAGIPEIFSQADVQRLLNAVEARGSSFRRTYAMLRCMTDLGLRACEVARLSLSDINWDEGILTLPTSKLRRGHTLPLPQEVGQAIADYLRLERPPTSDRSVFVRHRAPYDKPIATAVVRRAIFGVYRRCGWQHYRVHMLRHSVASTLLKQGAPLKEIADLLRHRSLDTSMIYTKVDLPRLAAVALPWPGGQL